MIENFSNAPPSIFGDQNYIHYIVEYQGNIVEDSKNSSTMYITVINNKYAVISMPLKSPTDRFTLKNNPFPSIVYISRYYGYTLQSLSPIIAANINLTQIESPFFLTGKGVIVGMIDTGIDYLNKEFMNDDGTTRILNIWDQTIKLPNVNGNIPFGSIYTNTDINNAIKAYNEGNDPYRIVPSKDELGHGTAMAGIIGAKGLNPEVKGAAPDCEYVVVKLIEALSVEKYLTPTVPIYGRTSIMFALNYLYQYAITVNKPMVIFLPLGTTFGNHKGDGLLEDFINDISNNKGLAVVTGSGNEADTSGHASGRIEKKGDFKDIPLYISDKQNFLRIEIWVDKPNIMSLEIISSSGENSGIIPAFLNQQQTNQFIFEKTIVTVTYYLPDELSGDELIVIDMSYLRPGTWKLRLFGDYVLDGTYNSWLLPKGLTLGDTRFISPDPYGTFTGPGSSEFIITVANYNQNNYNLVNSSGMAFLNNVKNGIDIAAGGVNVKTIAPNNKTAVISGTSVSAAVVAGASALMFQWGITDGNDPDMYAQKLRTYLSRGTSKRMNDVYPNAEWGYGVLDMIGVFKYLQ
ncbi:S8 family peptidase [Clostridium septicum]|uniref:Peptidase S8 n=1 Tax=Clostridium septicum TaxID=1504 RepID=A0A9N7JKM3_CLOSE|nr:S8 family peptidase [Clostridium septicum]AYE33621.1 peptidase S8 [Clostridium septicum]MDU1312834.1 S8 family peptidase [Clostridium septicum]QAS61785.1 peptidase S8 [Clostridium septicum]UEC21767.1 S8 family peptidase [Clostridium septicum]USS00181.1 S8 family peptidase [Clostridium septicum]